MEQTITCDGKTIFESDITIIGKKNIIKGDRCIIKGSENKIYGNECDVYGNTNMIYGAYTNVYGDWNENRTDDWKLASTNAGQGNMNSGTQANFDRPMNIRPEKRMVSFTDMYGQKKEMFASDMLDFIQENNKEQGQKLTDLKEFYEKQLEDLKKKQKTDFESCLATLYQQCAIDKAKKQSQNQVEDILRQARGNGY